MRALLLLPLACLLPLAASAGISPSALSNNADVPFSVSETRVEEGYLYKADSFCFSSPLRIDMAAMEDIALLFENTCASCEALPLGFASHGMYSVRIFRDRTSFVDALGQLYRQTPGVYMNGAILLPAETLGLDVAGDKLVPAPGKQADTDTLIHELAHQLTLKGSTWDTPTWFGEGIAEYLRLATDSKGNADAQRVKEAIAPYVIQGRKLGQEFTAPPLERFMNLSRMEFNQATGQAGQFHYGFATLLTWYFLHLDGEGDSANLTRWMQHLQTTPKATAHLRYKLPPNATPEQIAAEKQRLWKEMLATREVYYYEPLLNSRSWQELEAEISRKVQEALGITLHFRQD